MSIDKRIFEGCVEFFSTHSAAKKALAFIYKVLPNLMFFAYAGLLVYAHFQAKEALPRLVGSPLGVLIVVSVLRYIINTERPYERFGRPSVFNKQTVRKSMPSRHTASAFIIAVAVLYINLPLGIVATVCAFLIGASRVLAGAHFLRDVLAGAGLAVLSGLLAFYIL